jgi:hypothetical protein
VPDREMARYGEGGRMTWVIRDVVNDLNKASALR